MKWIKKLFEPPVDKTEQRIKSLFQFLSDDYGFQFAKMDLGDLVDRDGKLLFYGPLYAYQVYNEKLCINILHLVQRDDYTVYITEKQSCEQNYIHDGLQLPSYLENDLPLLAAEVKGEVLRSRTIFGNNI